MNGIIEKENIETMIYEIRGKQVMLDSDLARLYQCKNGTKEVNQAVNRNNEKFPERFSWKLSDKESLELLVTICDQKKSMILEVENIKIQEYLLNKELLCLQPFFIPK